MLGRENSVMLDRNSAVEYFFGGKIAAAWPP
jgi:hypothetical protein